MWEDYVNLDLTQENSSKAELTEIIKRYKLEKYFGYVYLKRMAFEEKMKATAK